MEKLELAFLLSGVAALGTWLFSKDYEAYGLLGMIFLLTLASVYLLMTKQEKLYRIFASFSLTVICAALGIAFLRMSGLIS